MNIKNRVLELSNKDFKNILKNKGNTILEQLEEELNKNGYIFKDFSEIQLNGTQLRDRKYIEVYCNIVCSFWNKKDVELLPDEEIKSMSKSERLSYYKQMIEAGKMTPNHIRKLEYNLIREKEN